MRTDRLADHVVFEMDAARRDRQWEAIETRVGVVARAPRGRGRRRHWLGGVALASAVAAAVFFVARPWLTSQSFAPRTASLDEASETFVSVSAVNGMTTGSAFTLPDGSHARLSPAGRVRLPAPHAEDVRMRLDRGRIDLDVVHVPTGSRRFVVLAGDLEVRVTGTAFSVERTRGRDDDSVTVSVRRGSVVVRRRGETIGWPIGAGESFTSRSSADPLDVPGPEETKPAASPPAPAASPRRRAVRAAAEARVIAAARPAAAPRASRPGGGPPPPLEAAPPASPPPLEAAPPASPPPLEGAPPVDTTPPAYTTPLVDTTPPARRLLAEARRARAEGRLAEAEAALTRICTELRGDPRAALAAFELGRLRLDRLDDAPRAAAALRDAVRLDPDAAFREDVEARLVEALERSGDRPACLRAQRAFSSRWPHSAHAAVVATRCAGPP